MKQVLSEVEYRFARGIGLARMQANGEIPDPSQGGMDPTEMHVRGALGEFAFCKAANIWPPIEAVRAGKRPVYDCMWCGNTVDVKTGGKGRDGFNVTLSKSGNRCALYVFVEQLSPYEYELVGMISSEAVFAREPALFAAGDKQKRYIVKRDELMELVLL